MFAISSKAAIKHVSVTVLAVVIQIVKVYDLTAAVEFVVERGTYIHRIQVGISVHRQHVAAVLVSVDVVRIDDLLAVVVRLYCRFGDVDF